MSNVEKCKIDLEYINNSAIEEIQQSNKQTIIKTDEFYCSYDCISESFQVWVILPSGKEGFLYGFLEIPLSSYSSEDAESLQVNADIWNCEITEEILSDYLIGYDSGYIIIVEIDSGKHRVYNNIGILLNGGWSFIVNNGNQFSIEHKKCYTDDDFYTMANGELIRRGIKAN